MKSQIVKNLFFRTTKSSRLSQSFSRRNSNYYTHELSQTKGYVIIKLAKPPVNSFNLPALNEFNSLLDRIERDNKLKGVVLSSVLF